MAFLPAVAAVASVAGPLIGGIEEHNQLKASARADRANANRTEFQGELDAWETERQARLAQGAGLALAAADGNPVGTGTIADLVEQASLERELEIGNLRAKARGEAYNLRVSAKQKKRAAKFAIVKGVLGGIAAAGGAVAGQRNQAALDAAGARDRASRATPPLGRGIVAGDATMPSMTRRRWGGGF